MSVDLPVIPTLTPSQGFEPAELPVVGNARPERADAARNRERILSAARTLFAQDGVRCTSMDAIARKAGVGKGTLFRRFGDRATLALALLDEDERALQEGFIRGPAPLGPGAPPCRRLIAFGEAMLDHLEANWELMLEGEAMSGGRFGMSAPYRVRWLHVHSLVAELRADGDVDFLSDALLAPLTATVFAHQRIGQGMALGRIKAGYADLATRTLA